MPDAARVGDNQQCTMPTPRPHVGGPITTGSENVDTNSIRQVRATDRAVCTGVPIVNFVVTGSTTVEINGKLAARKTDKMMHAPPGAITQGSANVEIGGATGGATLGNPDAAAARCRAAAAGRTSGTIQQSYQNCGVESTRQLINQQGNNISEDGLLNQALRTGDAETAKTGPWYWRSVDRANSGGTGPAGRNAILNRNGVPSSLQPQGIDNIQQAVALDRGVITSHDAGLLWGQAAGGGHAIVTTGAEYDANGNLKNVIVNDTGDGTCRKVISARQYNSSLRPGRDINVTNTPIW